MNMLIETLLHLHARYPGFFAVLLALVKGTAILLMAEGIAMMLNRRSARARAWVWRVALLMLALLAAWPLRPPAMKPLGITLNVTDRTGEPLFPERVLRPETTAVVPVPVAVAMSKMMQAPAGPNWRSWLRQADDEVLHLWALGFIALATLKVLRQAFGRALLRRGSALVDHAVQALYPAGLCCRISPRASSPLITGMIKPTIWLPAGALGWDEMKLRAALQHELAHHMRRDVLWQCIGTIAACAWWWLPLSWLALRRLKAETEQAADDWTVSHVLQPSDYAEALVQIAQAAGSDNPQCPGIPMAGFSELETRVRALLRDNPWRNRVGLLAGAALSLLTICLLGVVLVSCQKRPPEYISLAKLVAGGSGTAPHAEDFYGTIIEILESSEMRRHAVERVRVLNPDLKEADVAVRVNQNKGSSIFNVAAVGSDREYVKTFLNALLDEFKAFREMNREQPNKALTALEDDVASREKQLKEQGKTLMDFEKNNNVVVISQNQNQAAEMLRQCNNERERLREQLTEVEQALKDVEGSVAGKRLEASGQRTSPLADSSPSAGLTRPELDYLNTRSELVVCQVDLQTLREAHKADSEKVQEAELRMARLEKLRAVYSRQVTDMLQARQADTERRLKMNENKMAELELQAAEAGTKLAKYNQLKRDLEDADKACKEVFELAHRFKVNEVMAGEYVQVMERPSTAVEDVRPWWRF